MNVTEHSALVAPCGIYCGACFKYKKGNCPGCSGNDKATWCKIRICTKDHGFRTCADCREFSDVNECRKFNTFFAKIFAFIFRSDRKASLHRIAEIGINAYGDEMEKKGLQVIKRK
jgi:hypothetical protein